MNIAQHKAALPICLEIEALPRSGNNIPNAWYQHLKRDGGTKEAKANFPAITILSEIVWWYRPTEQRDEATGQSLEPTRKFKADKLQLSYAAMANKFGMSKRQATDACKYLADKRLITLEFRTLKLPDGRKLNNVLYVEPIPTEIAKISVVPASKNGTPVTKESDSISQTNGTPPTNKRETNTDNTNKDLQTNNASHTHTEQSANAQGVCGHEEESSFSDLTRGEENSSSELPTPGQSDQKPTLKPPAASSKKSNNEIYGFVKWANKGFWSLKVTKTLERVAENKTWDDLKKALQAMCEQYESEEGLKHQQRYFIKAVSEGWEASQEWHERKDRELRQKAESERREKEAERVKVALKQMEVNGDIELIDHKGQWYDYRLPGDVIVYNANAWDLPKGFSWREDAA